MHIEDTIVALSTGKGGAISVIRMSGKKSFDIISKIFISKNVNELTKYDNKRGLLYGEIIDQNKEVIDDVVLSYFKSPNSYTGEDSIEISCHASNYIIERILSLLTDNGARLATGGEYTMRAYLNGKIDLVKAEAVADLISSTSEASHKMAIKQMKGGYSKEFSTLRDQLLKLASLLELELDFSEEDVEFADRSELNRILNEIKTKVEYLTSSFKQGNALKNGIPTVIVGSPNVGKSTLLNAFLRDDRAIVSSIAGTTRDTIEEVITLGGVIYRFIDTAGIRETTCEVESIGIEKTFKKIEQANLVIILCQATDSIETIISQIENIEISNEQDSIIVINKIDLVDEKTLSDKIDILKATFERNIFSISANSISSIYPIEEYLINTYSGGLLQNEITINNVRHYTILKSSLETINRAIQSLNENQPSDLIAADIRHTILRIGELVGSVSSDNILHNIFKNFCIGK